MLLAVLEVAVRVVLVFRAVSVVPIEEKTSVVVVLGAGRR